MDPEADGFIEEMASMSMSIFLEAKDLGEDLKLDSPTVMDVLGEWVLSHNGNDDGGDDDPIDYEKLYDDNRDLFEAILSELAPDLIDGVGDREDVKAMVAWCDKADQFDRYLETLAMD